MGGVIVKTCPECNAHWVKLENGTKIILPNYRLPRITREGNTKYLTQKDLVRILAEHFRINDVAV